ncbi:MAG: hypothetical protein KA347_02295, partial [Bacteroidia bacterium]|nr:hypothetical protein [Bacteroidia bacterium]MBP7243927.1 hypothetical protein [Bacteroidia bacterium]
MFQSLFIPNSIYFMHFIGLVHFALYIFVKYSLRHDQSETSTSYFILIFHPAGIGSKKRNESSE